MLIVELERLETE